MIVVDASLATKWLLQENDSGAALAFLNKHERAIVGPDLLAIEVSRALVTAANMKRIDRETARTLIGEWLQALDRGAPRLQQLGTALIERGAMMALDLSHPLPDCLYLALAVGIGAELATSDVKFAAKARTLHPAVKLLADYA